VWHGQTEIAKVSQTLKIVKKNFIIIIACFLYGCSVNNDEFFKIKFGKVSYSDFKGKMISDKLFIQPNEENNSFRYYVEDDGYIIPVEVEVNPDKYYFGELRQLKLNLGGDTVSYLNDNIKFSRAAGKRIKEDIDNLYNIYCKWYGQPDSIFIFGAFGKNEILIYLERKNLDTCEIFNLKKAYWYTDKFKLTFEIQFLQIDERLDTLVYGENSNIFYEMYNYYEKISAIRDSIKELFSPNDILNVTISPDKIYWSDYEEYSELSIPAQNVERKEREEEMGVMGFKFDIVITDIFNEEIYRINDFSFDFDKKPLASALNGRSWGNNFIEMPFILRYKYDLNTVNFNEIEKVRDYCQKNKIKIYADINAVVFEDGSVIK
jgi:hypothetical protein